MTWSCHKVFSAVSNPVAGPGRERRRGSYIRAETHKDNYVQVSDDIGAFVCKDYEARGGAMAADLLDEHSVLEDSALVETILLEKLAAAAEEARAEIGFAWADAVIQYDYAAMADYGRQWQATAGGRQLQA